MKRLALGFAITARFLVVLCGMAPRASADQVTWDLSGVTFSDGGTASGSFVYNADTNTVSSVDFTTTAGGSFGGATYAGVDPGFGPSATDIVFVTDSSLLDFTGTPVLQMIFASALTDLGGTILLSGTGEGVCANIGCTSGIESRIITGGEVFSAPEPSSLLLLGMGMFGLVGAAKRKVLNR